MSLERAAACVAEHPWVAHVQVGPDGGLRVQPAPAALALQPAPGRLLREYLEHWAEVYDWVYESGEARYADDLDLSGWRASDTGRPLPPEHMVEWVERAVALVLRSRPRRVLELGCGTGLLLHRLNRQVEVYVGTDVSRTAVERLQRAGLPGVAVVEAAAHEARSARVQRALESLAGEGARPDCVVLNSVTQHFPNVEYLALVLRDAIDLVAAGGTVVVGDVRHAALLGHYCRWLERAADPAAPPEELERRAAARAAREEELLIDPRLLARVAAAVTDRTVLISVHAKTMRADTELTRYRYDAVLHVDPPALAPAPERVPWSALPAADRLAALRRRVEAGGAVLVHGIPNRLLAPAADAVSAYELLAAVAGVDADVCLDIEEPTLLAVAAPAAVARWRPGQVRGLEDGQLAHEPLPRYVSRRLPEVLRDHLRRACPEQAGVPITVAL